MTITIGFDPGLTGAVAVLSGERLVDVADLPVHKVGKKRRLDAAALLASPWVTERVDTVVIESLHAMGINGSQANFSQGHSLGVIEGVCAGMKVEFITPQAWKAEHPALVGSRAEQKVAGRLLCQRLWPDFAPSFARAKDDGRADAALIALAWVRKQERDA